MTELAAWVLFPLVALLACLGTGLLTERLAGLTLPPPLVPPLGFAAGTCLVGYGYVLGVGIWPALVLLGAATVAGLFLARGKLAERFRPGPGALAGAGVYALYMAPVVLSGSATFLGYNLLNDTAVHLLLVDYVTEFGRDDPSGLAESSFKSAAEGYIGLDYPVGSHELLATLRWPLGIDVAHVYQPYLAFAVALFATVIAGGLRRAGAPVAAAVAAALVAPASQLLFSFNLQGGIKELTFLTCFATAAALGAELLRREAGMVRLAALTALPLAAGYAIYSWAALAWIGPFALLLAAAAFAFGARRELLPAAGAGAVALVALALPTLAVSFDFAEKSEDVLTAETELGPLIGPLRTIQVAGIWLNGDYRAEPVSVAPTELLAAFALVLAALGAALALRRRVAAPLLLGLPALIAWAGVAARGSPYAESKALAIASPAVVLLACLGVAALWRGRARPVAAAAALVLVGALLLGDAYAYREARLAPIDRLEELGDAGKRFAGQGPMLVNEFEEYSKHFARDALPVSPYETWTPQPAQLRPPGGPVYAHAYDLDQLTYEYVAQWPLIALRRSPAASRPPASYELAWSGDWYEVWRRRSAPAADAHEPLGDPPVQAAATPACDFIARLTADRSALALERAPAPLADLGSSKLPVGWRREGEHPPVLATRLGGNVSAPVETGAGRHRLWVMGRIVRESDVLVDGRKVGTAEHLNGPNQWIDVGSVDLAAGRHVVELRRPTGSLAPGDKGVDHIGPAALVPEREPRLVRAAEGSGSLCERSLDWIERLPR